MHYAPDAMGEIGTTGLGFLVRWVAETGWVPVADAPTMASPD